MIVSIQVSGFFDNNFRILIGKSVSDVLFRKVFVRLRLGTVMWAVSRNVRMGSKGSVGIGVYAMNVKIGGFEIRVVLLWISSGL